MPIDARRRSNAKNDIAETLLRFLDALRPRRRATMRLDMPRLAAQLHAYGAESRTSPGVTRRLRRYAIRNYMRDEQRVPGRQPSRAVNTRPPGFRFRWLASTTRIAAFLHAGQYHEYRRHASALYGAAMPTFYISAHIYREYFRDAADFSRAKARQHVLTISIAGRLPRWRH